MTIFRTIVRPITSGLAFGLALGEPVDNEVLEDHHSVSRVHALGLDALEDEMFGHSLLEFLVGDDSAGDTAVVSICIEGSW